MANTEREALIQFIEDEIRQTKKRCRQNYVAGLIIALIVAAYMAFILHMEKVFLEPENMAFFIASEAKRALPAAIADTEQTIATQAWEAADAVSQRFLELVPEFTAVGKEHIDLVTSEMIPYINDELSLIIQEYIHQNSAELMDFAEKNNNKAFAQRFTNEIMAEFEAQMNARIIQLSGGRGIDYVEENMTIALLAMNQTLDELMTKKTDEMTAVEALQRRIIARLAATAMDRDTP